MPEMLLCHWIVWIYAGPELDPTNSSIPRKHKSVLDLLETQPSGEALQAWEELQQMQRSIGAVSLTAQLLHHQLGPLSCRWGQRWTTMAQTKRLFSTSAQRLWPCRASESEIAPDDPTSTRAAPDIVQPAAATQRRSRQQRGRTWTGVGFRGSVWFQRRSRLCFCGCIHRTGEEPKPNLAERRQAAQN